MDTDFKEIGKKLMEGALLEISRIFVYGLILLAVWGALRGAFSIGLDTTDKDGWHRSGMKLMTDHQTGVQYLSDGNGGLHVRIDASGKPITGK